MIALSPAHVRQPFITPRFKGNDPVMRTLASGYLRAPKLSAFRNFLSNDAFQKITSLSGTAVQFKNRDNVSLYGCLYPTPQPSRKTMVVGHGYMAHSGSMLSFVQPLHEMGYNVFVFDFKAHGKSEGKKTTLGFHEGKDIAAAVEFLKKEYDQYAEELSYLGHSMGGAAYLYMPRHLDQANPSQFSKVILDSSYAFIHPSEDPNVTRFLKFLPNVIKKALLNVVANFERQSKEMLDLPEPLNTLYPSKIYGEHPEFHQTPILLLHGKQDSRTPFSHAEHIHQDLLSQGVPVRLVPLNTDHFVTDWKPAPNGKQYMAVLRDEERYLQALRDFEQGSHSSVLKID